MLFGEMRLVQGTNQANSNATCYDTHFFLAVHHVTTKIAAPAVSKAGIPYLARTAMVKRNVECCASVRHPSADADSRVIP